MTFVFFLKLVYERLPVEIWFEENPKASDVKLEENIRMEFH